MNNAPNRNNLLRYAGLTMQILAGIGVALFAGIKLDQYLRWQTPVFTWVLPLLVIAGMLYSIIKDTSKKRNEE